MNKILSNSWALFLGMGCLMMAYGFQGSLLGVRAVEEEFSLLATGFMMSGYFTGYFIGAKIIPILISNVGHVRVFAAFASIASLIILLHSVLIGPLIWFILRVITGISMVSIYTVAESWLNDRASNKNRGSILSIYMVVIYAGMGIGMFFLNFSNPSDFEPFILISVLTSVALIPILLTKKKAPTFKKIKAMSLGDVYKASPFGMVSALFYGTIQSALFTLLAVYAASMNFSIFDISLVTFLLAISGAISQWPIGKISDLYDRRKVIIISTFASAFFAFCAILASNQMYLPGDLASNKGWFYLSLILFSVCSLPMFSLILAHTNDFIPKEKFVAAGASLQFTFGMGAMSGPFLCSIFMNIVGLNGFFIFIIFFHLLIGLFGLYRTTIREVVNNPDSQFVAMPSTITAVGIELSPTVGSIEDRQKTEDTQVTSI
jgi:MFS family permease